VFAVVAVTKDTKVSPTGSLTGRDGSILGTASSVTYSTTSETDDVTLMALDRVSLMMNNTLVSFSVSGYLRLPLYTAPSSMGLLQGPVVLLTPHGAVLMADSAAAPLDLDLDLPLTDLVPAAINKATAALASVSVSGRRLLSLSSGVVGTGTSTVPAWKSKTASGVPAPRTG